MGTKSSGLRGLDIDQELLNKTQRYVIENTKFNFVSSLFHNAILLAFLFGGLLDSYNSWIASLKVPFIVSGLVFFLILLYADTVLMIPFKLYHTFVIENKYGFTTTTMKLWITDLWKSLLITTIMVSFIIATDFSSYRPAPVYGGSGYGVFLIIQHSHDVYIPVCNSAPL
ncbi:MAG: hypothetical protein HS127_14340 [Planctomycetia bacterium]|nr:hypothetical protein [Planctomycetia bacterium]